MLCNMKIINKTEHYYQFISAFSKFEERSNFKNSKKPKVFLNRHSFFRVKRLRSICERSWTQFFWVLFHNESKQLRPAQGISERHCSGTTATLNLLIPSNLILVAECMKMLLHWDFFYAKAHLYFLMTFIPQPQLL